MNEEFQNKDLLLIIIIVFFSSFLGTIFMRSWAIRKSIVDIPNERSSHRVPTPRGGGVSIAFVWYSVIVLLLFLQKIELNLFLALASGLFLSIISFIDDIKNLTPKTRLIFQLLSSGLAITFIKLVNASFSFEGLLMTEVFIAFIFGGIIIWFINLFNFLDGSDGYLGMEGIFFFLSMYYFTNSYISLVFAFIIAGFTILNLPKAKIFCGDVGSTLIGYNVAIISLYYIFTSQIHFTIPLILSSLFWFDATITLARRVIIGDRITEAHRKHSYQRLIQSGLSHWKVLIIGMTINSILFVFAYLTNSQTNLYWLFSFCSILVLFLFIKYSDYKKPFYK